MGKLTGTCTLYACYRLNPGTPYYLRAYAPNSVGTSYGEEIPFTTDLVDIYYNEDKLPKLYPNPAHQFAYLDIGEVKIDILVITIKNITGQMISIKEYRNLTDNQIIELDISKLPQGNYLINTEYNNSRRVFLLVKI